MRAGNLKNNPADRFDFYQHEVSRKKADTELAEMTADQFHVAECRPCRSLITAHSALKDSKDGQSSSSTVALRNQTGSFDNVMLCLTRL